MPSTSEASASARPSFVESIKGKITLANLTSVLVLLVVAAFATFSFASSGSSSGPSQTARRC